MNFLQFTAPASAWLFLLLVPLIAFYFLKLKRPRMEIPSLVLWRQVINDQRVNSPFQRFKRNLLLLMQILLLVLLVVAATQPYLQSGAERAKYLPVLIDCSASMAALDKPGGEARLDVAKQRVQELIDTLLPDQRLSLIAVGSTARRLTDFTNNTRLLSDALEKISVLDVASNPEDALRMSQALSRTVPIETVLFYSDGNLPEQVDFELPFVLQLQQLPAAGPNMGITALNARRGRKTAWDVFARIEGSNHAPTSATAELLRDDEIIGEETIVLEQGKSQRLVFKVDAEGATALTVRLKPDGFDSLETDNRAFLDIPAGRRLRVFCAPELASYRHALAAHPELDLVTDENEKSTSSGYDLLVSDRADDMALEASVSLFVGIIPDDLQQFLKVQTGLAQIVDWERASSLLQHVQLADVQIADEPISGPNVRDATFEELGYVIIAHSRTGPLVLQRRDGEKLAYYLLFHSDRSTLPYRVGFPILVSNAVEIATHQASIAEVRAASTGVLPEKSLLADREYRVVGPDGNRRDAKSNANGVLSGIAATKVGKYVIDESGREVAQIGASLLDARETSLSAVEEIQFRELSVSTTETRIKSDRPLWSTFAMLAFGMLLVEWWYFQRRPGGPPR